VPSQDPNVSNICSLSEICKQGDCGTGMSDVRLDSTVKMCNRVRKWHFGSMICLHRSMHAWPACALCCVCCSAPCSPTTKYVTDIQVAGTHITCHLPSSVPCAAVVTNYHVVSKYVLDKSGQQVKLGDHMQQLAAALNCCSRHSSYHIAATGSSRRHCISAADTAAVSTRHAQHTCYSSSATATTRS
jgi:hypothetical protein